MSSSIQETAREPVQAAASSPILVGVVSEGSPRLEACLLSLLASESDRVEVVVVDVSGRHAAEEVCARYGIQVLSPASGKGFAAGANSLAYETGEEIEWLVFCHDEVALEPDAVVALVEGAESVGADIAGPKVKDWSHPGVLREVGFGCDKFGYHRSNVDPAEADKGQQDRLREVFFVSTTCMAVRRSLFLQLGGFDASLGSTEVDLDFCWRARLLGARVAVVPEAVVYHDPSSLDAVSHRSAPFLARRNRLRILTKCWGLSYLLVVLALSVLQDAAEVFFRAVTGRRPKALETLGVWARYFAGLGSTLRARRVVQRTRRVDDATIRSLQSRGSLRVRSALERQLHREVVAEGGEPATILQEAGSGVGEFILHELTRPPVNFWLVWLVFAAVASRNLLFSRLAPVVGQLGPLSTADPLLRDYFNTWHPDGLGYSGFAPPAQLLGGAFQVLGLGRPVAPVKLFLVVMYVLGAWGIWTWARRISGPRWEGAAVATVLYCFSAPVLGSYETGSVSGILAVGLLPWCLLACLGTIIEPRGAIRRAALASAGLFLIGGSEPLLLAAVLAAAAAVTLVSPLTGKVLRSFGSLVVSAFACAAGGALVALWLTQAGNDFSMLRLVVEGWPDARLQLGVGGVMRLQTTELGGPPLGYILALLAVLAIVVGTGERLSWAIRCIAGSLPVMVAVWLAGQGKLPAAVEALPALFVLPACLFSVAAGLGMDAVLEKASAGERAGADSFDDDRKRPRWAAALSLGIVVASCLAAGPGFLRAAGGSLGVAHTGFDKLVEESPDRPNYEVGVLWLGSKEAIPGPARPLPNVGGAYSVTGRLPRATWGRPSPVPDDFESALADTLARIAAPGFTRGGKLLARLGIRYVVIAEDPGRYPVGSRRIPSVLADAFGRQLDISEIGGSRRARVFRVADESAVWTASAFDFDPLQRGAAAQATFATTWMETELTGVAPVFSEPVIGARGEVSGRHVAVVVFKEFDSDLALRVLGEDGRSTIVRSRKALGWANAIELQSALDTLDRGRSESSHSAKLVELLHLPSPGAKTPVLLQLAGFLVLLLIAALARPAVEEELVPERLAAYADLDPFLRPVAEGAAGTGSEVSGYGAGGSATAEESAGAVGESAAATEQESAHASASPGEPEESDDFKGLPGFEARSDDFEGLPGFEARPESSSGSDKRLANEEHFGE
jgi:GT2 family glycosyltransferase